MARARLTLFPVLAALAVPAALPAPARAGEVACAFEGGVVVVPAQVAGVAGDYILDTGAPRTLLHDTKARAEGIEAEALMGEVRLAGLALAARPVGVADLDVRGWNLPTPIAGLVGADVLKDFVVDVAFAPCRVGIWRRGAAPPFRAARSLPLAWDAGRPAVRAWVGDEARTLEGLFVVSTGANTAVRLAEDLAAAPGAPAGEIGPDGRWLARLAELGFAGRTLRDAGAGLTPPEGEAAGVIGGPALAGPALRFDFPAGRLRVAPAPR